MRRTVLAATFVALAASGCGGNTGTPIRALGDSGWGGAYANAHNSSYSSQPGSEHLALDWSRPLGGAMSSPIVISPSGDIFVTSDNQSGCNTFTLSVETGRMRNCQTRDRASLLSAPAINATNYGFLGRAGALDSFAADTFFANPRWAAPVTGTPVGTQLTSDRNVLTVTHKGQVAIIDTQRGTDITPRLSLIPAPPTVDASGYEDGVGVSDCNTGGDDCPVASVPAIDLATDRFYVTVRLPGADKGALVALTYHRGDGDQQARVTQDWSTPVLGRGSRTSPVLSEDAKTVYINDLVGDLHAVNAADGKLRWTYHLGYDAMRGPSVSPDGSIIASGGEDAPLTAVAADGKLLWRRDDVATVSPTVQTSTVGYTVQKTSAGLSLLAFDPKTGETVEAVKLEGAQGYCPALAIGPEGQVVVTTAIGEVFSLR